MGTAELPNNYCTTSTTNKTIICFAAGGGKRDRTADLLHAMQALSQLSYTPRAQKHCYFFTTTTPDRTGVPKGIRTPVLTVKG